MKCFVFSCFMIAICGFCNEKPLISLGVGAFDIKHKKYRATEFQVEYRPAKVFYTIRPTVGMMVTTKRSLYFYSGFGFEWFYKRLFFSPNFAVGIYRQNQGKDLGFLVEFRSGIEAGIRFPNFSRIGVQFYHISNARKLFHWSKRNPGAESLVLIYNLPI